MENERVERELWAVRPGRYSGGVSRGCNDATSASSSSKNFVVPSVRASSLDIDNQWWRGSRDSRVQNRNWSDVSCTLVASTRVATNDLLSGERSTPRSRVIYWQVINSNHIELRRFLEDTENVALEWMQDAVERHGSVKVNTAFNGEFATKDKG